MQRHVIIVIDPDATLASRLEEEIQFMDDTQVCVAGVDEWRDRCAGRRIEALFVGPGVADNDMRALLDDVEEFDPNLAIVLVGDRQLAA